MRTILAFLLTASPAFASEWWYNGQYYAQPPASITIGTRGIIAPSDALMAEVATPALAEAVPTGKVKLSSSWALEDGVMVETGVYQDVAEWQAEQEAARQLAKSPDLKAAENGFLAAVATCNNLYGTDITASDSFQSVLAKLKASTQGERIDRLEMGVELQTLWNVVLSHGGVWGDVIWHEDLQ